VLAVLLLAFGVTFAYGGIARSNLQGRPWGFMFPAVGVVALVGMLVGARRKHDVLPFAMTVLFFLAAYLTLGTTFWPR
jgi:cytochrome d ubiquinol oxidase subunit II